MARSPTRTPAGGTEDVEEARGFRCMDAQLDGPDLSLARFALVFALVAGLSSAAIREG